MDKPLADGVQTIDMTKFSQVLKLYSNYVAVDDISFAATFERKVPSCSFCRNSFPVSPPSFFAYASWLFNWSFYN